MRLVWMRPGRPWWGRHVLSSHTCTWNNWRLLANLTTSPSNKPSPEIRSPAAGTIVWRRHCGYGRELRVKGRQTWRGIDSCGWCPTLGLVCAGLKGARLADGVFSTFAGGSWRAYFCFVWHWPTIRWEYPLWKRRGRNGWS